MEAVWKHSSYYVLQRRHLILELQKSWKNLDYVIGNVRTSIWLVNDAMGPSYLLWNFTVEDQGQYFDASASYSN